MAVQGRELVVLVLLISSSFQENRLYVYNKPVELCMGNIFFPPSVIRMEPDLKKLVIY
jgi:hypothetical protein